MDKLTWPEISEMVEELKEMPCTDMMLAGLLKTQMAEPNPDAALATLRSKKGKVLRKPNGA